MSDMGWRRWPVSDHTPGPWAVGFDANGWEDGDINVIADKCGLVCSIPRQLNGLYHSPGVGRTHDNQEANARLIAAAPELLAALQELVAYDEGSSAEGEYGYEVLHRCRSAIAKAEGRGE